MMGSHHKGRSIPKLLWNINSKPGASGATRIAWRPFTQQDSGINMFCLPLLTIKLMITMLRSVRLLLISLVCRPFFFIFICSLAADRRPGRSSGRERTSLARFVYLRARITFENNHVAEVPRETTLRNCVCIFAFHTDAVSATLPHHVYCHRS